jgi:aminocarboxymuconate-semialdehyde decarboxylase
VKVDLHTHILPKSWPNLRDKFGYGDWIRLEHVDPCCARMIKGTKHFRDVQPNCWEPLARLEDCDKCGVTTQVLSTVPVMFSYWAKPEHALELARILNDHIAEVCRAHPGRFAGLATLPMQDPKLAVRELERCVKELGLAGIQIGSHIERDGAPDWNLSEPQVFEVLQAAAALNACVFVHPWDMMGTEQMGKYWLPWLVGMPAESSRAICSVIFGGVLERLPNLRTAFAHGGGSFPGTIGRIEHGFNVRPDLVAIDNKVHPRDYLANGSRPARFYVDSLVHDQHALHTILRLVGPERIALGSDYPFPLGEDVPGALIESMDVAPEVRDRMLAGTAMEFLSGIAPPISVMVADQSAKLRSKRAAMP